MPSAVTSTSPSAAAAAGEPPAGAPSVHASSRPCQGSGGAAAMLSSPAAGCSNATAASSPGPSSIERTCSSPPGYVRLTTYCPGSSSSRSPGSRYAAAPQLPVADDGARRRERVRGGERQRAHVPTATWRSGGRFGAMNHGSDVSENPAAGGLIATWTM